MKKTTAILCLLTTFLFMFMLFPALAQTQTPAAKATTNAEEIPFLEVFLKQAGASHFKLELRKPVIRFDEPVIVYVTDTESKVIVFKYTFAYYELKNYHFDVAHLQDSTYHIEIFMGGDKVLVPFTLSTQVKRVALAKNK